MLIDTHCHLHFPDYDADRDQVIKRAIAAGVRYMITVGTDPKMDEAAYQLSQKYAEVGFTLGFHPHHLTDSDPTDFLSELDHIIMHKKPLAIGEAGLDYYKSRAPHDEQQALFVKLIHAALRHDLPLIVHSREAYADTFRIMKQEGSGKLKAVFHCYSYDVKALEEILAEGWSVSFTCNITYKKAERLLEAAIKVPIDRLMLETDAPYLSPQTKRGQRNEPAHVNDLAVFLADKRNISVETLMQRTTQNAVQFFRLPLKEGV